MTLHINGANQINLYKAGALALLGGAAPSVKQLAPIYQSLQWAVRGPPRCSNASRLNRLICMCDDISLCQSYSLFDHVQTDFPPETPLRLYCPEAAAGNDATEGQINLQDSRRGDIRMCGRQSKGRADKQASSWVSTGQMTLGNRLISSWHTTSLYYSATPHNRLHNKIQMLKNRIIL